MQDSQACKYIYCWQHFGPRNAAWGHG